jgi:hypothetical protein
MIVLVTLVPLPLLTSLEAGREADLRGLGSCSKGDGTHDCAMGERA